MRRSALVGLLALAAACGDAGTAPGGTARVDVDVVVRDLLEPELGVELEVVSAHPEHPPRVEGMCPSLDAERDGEDRLTLVLPPPAAVHFVVGDEGPARLDVAAGVGHGIQRQLDDATPRLDVHLEIEVDGRSVFRHTERVERKPRPRGYEWARVPANQPIELARGARVTLRTSCTADGERRVPTGALDVGFGGLRLVHTREVDVPPPTPERPNLILVVQDTQRRDRLTPYGYERDVSPNLAELARRGTVFDNAYATSSWTWPSTASLLTGLDPVQHGVRSEAACYLASALDVLPEVLQQAGYRTAGFSGSRIIVPSLNFDQGFERFDSFRGQFRKSGGLVPAALEWIAEHAGQRFFVYLHLVDTHAPHRPHPDDLATLGATRPADWTEDLFQEYTRRLGRGEGRDESGAIDPRRVVPAAHAAWLDDVYDASVRSGDRWVGALLEELDELGLRESTVVAFTSDHGEELFDHGKLEHGHTLHEELVRVPLIVAGPGIASGRRIETPVSTRHLATTFARLAGASLPDVPDPLDLVEPEARLVLYSTDHGVWEYGPRRPQYGVRDGSWVLHLAPDLGGGRSDQRLFRVDGDPFEQRDVARQHDDVAGDLRARVERVVSFLEQQRANPERAASESTMSTLRDIGYLGE